MSERISYSELKILLLECYYDYCRAKIISGKSWEIGECEIGYAYEQYCDSLEFKSERLMLEVISMILLGGRVSRAEHYHRQKIGDLIIENGIEEIMNGIPFLESEEVFHDMKVLKLI